MLLASYSTHKIGPCTSSGQHLLVLILVVCTWVSQYEGIIMRKITPPLVCHVVAQAKERLPLPLTPCHLQKTGDLTWRSSEWES